MIRIVTDSSTMYSIEEGKKNNIDILPLSVTINGNSYRELEEIHTEEFIEIINKGYTPVSSQPAIGEVVEAYEKYPNDEIINITMADGLSGTYNSACLAKTLVDHESSVTVINSKTLCGPHRYLVDLAVKLSELNKSKEEIVETLEGLIETSKSFLMPLDFQYLVRGGRLSPLVGRLGEVLKLVPVMVTSEDGTKIEKFATKRTFKKAIDVICENLKELGIDENYKIFISHAANESQALIAKDKIEKCIENANVEFSLLTPAFTTQGGPGCVAIQYIKRHELLV